MPTDKLNQRIVSIEADRRLSFYELEACARQGRMIADLAKLLPGNQPAVVLLDIPKEQYYCYVLEAMEDGLITTDLVAKWIDLVDARHDQVVACMKQQLDYWFSVHMLAPPQIKTVSDITFVRPALVGALDEGTAPNVGELLSLMAGQNELWHLVMQLQPPETLRDFINFGYSINYLQISSPANSQTRPLLLAVEDRDEVKILQTAQHMGRLISGQTGRPLPRMMGWYPLEMALVAGSGTSLYLNDPGTQFDDGERVYSSEELLGELYGAEFTPEPSLKAPA
jgi:hypothetical protein